MLKLATILMFTSTAACAAPQANVGIKHKVEVVSVYDGDTFSIRVPGMWEELQPLKVRVQGIDTPERGSKAKCKAERDKADAARRFTVDQLKRTNNVVYVSNVKWDKYGGRVDADVYVGTGNESLSEQLIKHGHGRSYHGEARTKGWCF